MLAEEKDLVLLPDELSFSDGAQKIIGIEVIDERIKIAKDLGLFDEVLKAGEAYALMASGKCGKVAVVFDEEIE